MWSKHPINKFFWWIIPWVSHTFSAYESASTQQLLVNPCLVFWKKALINLIVQKNMRQQQQLPKIFWCKYWTASGVFCFFVFFISCNDNICVDIMDATLHKPGWSAVGIQSRPLNAMFFHMWDLNYNPTLHMLSPPPHFLIFSHVPPSQWPNKQYILVSIQLNFLSLCSRCCETPLIKVSSLSSITNIFKTFVLSCHNFCSHKHWIAIPFVTFQQTSF